MSHIDPDAIVKTDATKAVVGAIVAGILAFLTPIGTTLHAGDPITAITWFDSIVSALVFAGAVFPSVYYPTNKVK